MNFRQASHLIFAAAALAGAGAIGAVESRPDFGAVQRIFQKHCLDCHSRQDPEGKLVLETHGEILQGGESGPVIVPGNSGASQMVRMVEGKFEKEGKIRIMPPGKREKLTESEILAIRDWIDRGAPAPEGVAATRILETPRIEVKAPLRRGVTAMAYSPAGDWLAVGRHGIVELWSAASQGMVRTLAGQTGPVNGLVFSADGSVLFAAGGEPGLRGEVRQWKVSDGTSLRTLEGHSDAIYAVALSPDGSVLATGSYDQKILLWSGAGASEPRTLSGHNGAVFGLAFRNDGKLLASASADRTVKLWDTGSGERRDTLAQPLREVYAVAFSPDGRRLLAGGADNRIRIWQISGGGAETTNPLLESKFAHEGSILRLAFSPDGKGFLSSADDRTVKVWDASTLEEKRSLPQSDWPLGLACAAANETIVIGGLDGTVSFYEAATGTPQKAPGPELARLEPRGVARGNSTRVRFVGKHLAGVTAIRITQPEVKAEWVDGAQSASEAWVQISAGAKVPRGSYEVAVTTAGGESQKARLFVEDLPVRYEGGPLELPVTIWGTLAKAGAEAWFEFQATGEKVVFDVAAEGVGSKAAPTLEVFDAKGAECVFGTAAGARKDPLAALETRAGERYRVRIRDLSLSGSPEHVYRLTVGAFPFVTGCFPLSVRSDGEREVELVGHNLGADAKVRLTAKGEGEAEVPLDPERWRTRGPIRVMVNSFEPALETEPNDSPASPTPLRLPAAAHGRLSRSGSEGGGDRDFYSFTAKRGESWIVETYAARRGSPADTRLAILDKGGQPVPRLKLQAVRDSNITFRPIDSASLDCRVEKWEEMELNQYVYMQGEVVKIFRMPQGPDSGFLFYASSGKRRAYFDTSATSHANEEPCYIVVPHPPGTSLTPNGLPVFLHFFGNDDDGERKAGTDSKVHLTVPQDGEYLVRVEDSRGFGGEDFSYALVVRLAQPDFAVTVTGLNAAIPAGSGQGFTVSAERSDGFDGAITIELTGLPPGFSASSPLVIEAGHNEARGTVCAAGDAPAPAAANTGVQVTATAEVQGKKVSKEVTGFGALKLADKPKLWVALEPPSGAASGDSLPVLVIKPGETVPARLKITRNGHEDLVTFAVENLPHGVIVDNIGLNGVLIPKGENEREIFLAAAKWVPETDRLCFAIENQAGRQTSRPVLLRVRREELAVGH